jgi:uncharacterized repeat protein (TIGR01451 family)
MNNILARRVVAKGVRIGLAVAGGAFLLAAVLLVAGGRPVGVHAGPIDPPEGYPKLFLSVKTVTPTLAATGGVTLYYEIEIRNTGAYTAFGAALTDAIPNGTSYNGDAQSSVYPFPTVSDGVLTWAGDVGFDSTVLVNFSVSVPPAFAMASTTALAAAKPPQVKKSGGAL